MRLHVCTFVFSHRLQCDIELVPIGSVPSSLNVVDGRLGGRVELRFPSNLVHQLTDLLLVIDPVQRSGCVPCTREDEWRVKMPIVTTTHDRHMTEMSIIFAQLYITVHTASVER